MATRYMGISVGHGADARAVEVSSSTTGRTIELAFDKDAAGVDRTVLYNALGTLRDALMRQPWPMA